MPGAPVVIGPDDRSNPCQATQKEDTRSRPKHGVADDERRLARQPLHDLISPLDVEHDDSVVLRPDQRPALFSSLGRPRVDLVLSRGSRATPFPDRSDWPEDQ
jgi:hypothetical protein